MPLPGDLTTIQATGTFLDAEGDPMRGAVTFTPNATLTDASGEVIIPQFPRTYTLFDGTFLTDPMVSTDNADISPQGWAYNVTVAVQAVPSWTFTILLPHSGAPIDISTLLPTSGTPYLPGYLPVTGGSVSGTLTLGGSPALRITAGAAAGDTLTSDSSGNATWQSAATAWANVQNYGAKANAVTVTDGAMTASSATLTCSTSHQFTAASVGMSCVVQGAGAAGVALATTILAYVSSSVVTLAASASTTVSAASTTFGNDDTAAIQAAVNAAVAADGLVYFPPTAAWYNTTAPVMVSGGSALTLLGDGYRSVIKSTGNYDIFDLSSLGGLTVQSLRFDSTVPAATGGAALNLTSCANMFMIWVQSNNVWNGLSTTGSNTVTMLGCFFHGVNAGTYTQNAIHGVASQFGGGTYGIDLDSTSGSCSFVSCAFFGPLSLVTHNSLSRTNPNKGLTFINSGSNYGAGNGPPPEGSGGIDLNYCAGNVILDGCYNAGAGLRFGLNVTTFDTLHIVGGEYGGSGSNQADGIVMSKGTHITIHGAKLGGTANSSSDIISIASGVDNVVIEGNHFIGTCQYAINSAATGSGTGEIIIRDNDFTGITSSNSANPVNVPAGSIASYSAGGNTAGLTTTRATRVATLAAVSNVYTPSRDTMDEAVITSPAANFTLATPTGTPLDGDKLILRIRSSGTAYTPTWTTTSGGYEGSPGLPLPSSVTVSAVDYFGFKYNLTSAKWLLVAYMPGFA